FQAEDGIRDFHVTGVQTCALPIWAKRNGTGRTYHAACGKFGVIRPELEAEEAANARIGIAPEYGIDAPTPAGLKLKGTTTLTDLRTGDRVLQWVKVDEDRAAQEAIMLAAIKAMGEKIPREKPRPAPKHTEAALLNCYVLTALHLGSRSWPDESGEPWDPDIAEQMLVDSFASAFAQAPPAQTGVFAQLRDFLHWDGMEEVTEGRKHLPDGYTLFQRVVR